MEKSAIQNPRSMDEIVQLHNFERLQQLQPQFIWPSVVEMEPRSFIPEFLKVALSHQLCENLLAHPRRRLIHEGPLKLVEHGKTVDRYAFLFNDMFVLSKTKKYTLKLRVKGNSVDKTIHYVVQRQPVPLDSCIFCDAESSDSNNSMSLKFAFVIIHLNDYYQILSIYTLQAGDMHSKKLWIEKFRESLKSFELIQHKDVLKSTLLLSSLSLRRCSFSRLIPKYNKEKGEDEEKNGKK